ncbi:MAG: sugar-binding protein [Anaerolineae bacterium]
MPTELSAEDFLPRGAQLLVEQVVDFDHDGSQELVLLYRFPIGVPLFARDTAGDVHLLVRSLANSTYVPHPEPLINDAVDVVVADINGDGQDELILEPLTGGPHLFAHSGHGAWLELYRWDGEKLDEKIPFIGGRWDPERRLEGVWHYFSGLEPTLYYAGLKEATLSDDDGDGVKEVDISYTLEDGEETWHVDRYRWNGEVYAYAETFEQPAADPIPPEQFEEMIGALFPPGTLPTFFPAGKAQLPVQSIHIEVQRAEALNLDEDPELEMLWVYLVRPRYEDPEFDRYLDGQLGLAVFDDDGKALIWKPPPISGFERDSARARLATHADLVEVARGQAGLLFHHWSVFSGSGAGRKGITTLYHWTGVGFVETWRQHTAGGAQMGACCGEAYTTGVWLEDVDGDDWKEILTQHQEAQRTNWPPFPYNYYLTFPGALAYRWDGQSYSLAYLVDGPNVQRLRVQEPVFYSPRLSQQLTIDGNLWDFRQIEYLPSIEQRIGKTWSKIFTAWDDTYFYVGAEISNDHIVQTQREAKLHVGDHVELWLDTDLQGDFDEPGLNEDDFQIGLSPGNFADIPPEAYIWYPEDKEGLVREIQIAARRKESYSPGYTLEAAIPLTLLGLDGDPLVPARGWVIEGSIPQGVHEYYPQGGRAIGFAAVLSTTDTPGAAQQEDMTASSPQFQGGHPATFNTLIFMADRYR